MTKILLIVLIVLVIKSIRDFFQNSNNFSHRNMHDNSPRDDDVVEVDYEEVE